jgi:hypothetical protein
MFFHYGFINIYLLEAIFYTFLIEIGDLFSHFWEFILFYHVFFLIFENFILFYCILQCFSWFKADTTVILTEKIGKNKEINRNNNKQSYIIVGINEVI